MRKSREVSTACLDVTLQVNSAWMKQTARPTARHRIRQAQVQEHGAVQEALASSVAGVVSETTMEEETMLLCSDIISVDEKLRAQPDFDTTAYVMSQAIAHTQRFCNHHRTNIRAFRSVEVLRMVQPGLPATFLFVFEAIMVA